MRRQGDVRQERYVSCDGVERTAGETTQHEEPVARVDHHGVARLHLLLHLAVERVLAVDAPLQRRQQVQRQQRPQRAVYSLEGSAAQTHVGGARIVHVVVVGLQRDGGVAEGVVGVGEEGRDALGEGAAVYEAVDTVVTVEDGSMGKGG